MITPPVRRAISDITVVIPTIGRADLERCLQSITDGDAWPDSIIVVDQSPCETGVRTRLDRFRGAGLTVMYRRSEPPGIGAAMNRGLEQVTTRFVAVTHDDCEVLPDWLSLMSTRLHQEVGAIVTGQLRSVRPSSKEGGTASVVKSEQPAVYTRRGFIKDFLVVANMGFGMEIYRRVGPFSEVSLLRVAAEDNEWAFRVLGAGVPIIYDPRLRVLHHHWQTNRQLVDTHRRYALGQGALYGLYIARFSPIMALRAIVDMARAPWWIVRGRLAGNPQLVSVGRAYLRHLPAGILAGLRHGLDA